MKDESGSPAGRRLEQLKALTAKTKKPLPWYGLAMEYRSAGDTDSAIATFHKVHDLDQSYIAAYFMCAQVLAELGRNDEAKDELVKGIAHARAQHDNHALGEMQGLLDSLE